MSNNDKKTQRTTENQIDEKSFIYEQLLEAQKDEDELFENSPCGIHHLDKNGLILRINKTELNWFGYKKEELINTPYFDLFTDESKEKFKVEFAAYKARGYVNNVSFSVICHDGTICNISVNSIAHYDKDGNFVRSLSTVLNITEQRMYLEKITESEQLYKRLFEFSGYGISYYKIDGTIIDFNNKAAENMGGKPEDFAGKSIYDFFSKTDADFYMQRITRTASGEGIQEYEDFVTLKPGNKWFYSIFNKIVDLQGNITGVQIISQDITERKQMEISLRRSASQLQQILNNLQDAYFQADINGNFTIVNPIVLKMYAYDSLDELLGKPAEMLYADKNDRALLLNELRRRGSMVDYLIRGRRKDGTTFWASMNVQFVRDEDGNIIGTEGSVRDISERKKLEDDLQKNRKNLEVSNAKLLLMVQQSIKTISKIGELRDAYTAGHQRRVADLACAIARELELSAEQENNIFLGATIHDIGKIYVSSDILNKPGKITNLEYQLIQTHAEYGYEIVKDIDFPCQIATMIHQHHELLDGTGYPQGLTGDRIILESRILAVTDVVEAMVSHRPYRPALGIDAALEEISNFKGIKYDSDVVNTCIKLFREKGFKFTDL